MEDALAHCLAFEKENGDLSLNPCCNGRCTRTGKYFDYLIKTIGSLNPCCNGRCTRTAKLGLCFV